MRLSTAMPGRMVHVGSAVGGAEFSIRRANTTAELTACRKLVYRYYDAKGYLEADVALARLAGTFHGDQTHASPLARRRGQVFYAADGLGSVLATGTVIRDTRAHVSQAAAHFGLPLDSVVPAEMSALRQKLGPGAVLAEMGGLAAVAPSGPPGAMSTNVLRAVRTGAAHADPLTSLFATMLEHSRLQGVTDLVVGVHPTHARFYQRMGFHDRSSVGWHAVPVYAGLKNAAVVFLHAKVAELGLAVRRPPREPAAADSFAG